MLMCHMLLPIIFFVVVIIICLVLALIATALPEDSKQDIGSYLSFMA